MAGGLSSAENSNSNNENHSSPQKPSTFFQNYQHKMQPLKSDLGDHLGQIKQENPLKPPKLSSNTPATSILVIDDDDYDKYERYHDISLNQMNKERSQM